MASDERPSRNARAHSSSPPRERPWLLPYNRKLRHLQGITIRNLTLSPTPSRSRTKTIDDEGVPSSLKSPTKVLAQLESKTLTHSLSSSDLQSIHETPRRSSGSGHSRHPSTPTKSSKPPMSRGLRRRSTLEWSGASPLDRQKTLEDVTGGRMADTFFSLHVDGLDDPIYISEIAQKAMNPEFRFFDLASCGPRVTRLDKLTIKVWARNNNLKNWQYLIDFTVQLRALQFIGRSLEKFRHPLSSNCILFHMTDGIYTTFTDLPVGETIPVVLMAAPKDQSDGRVLPTSTYDALMRLSMLDDCIQDALAERDRLAQQIESILEENKEAINVVNQVPEAEERLRTVEGGVAAERRKVEAAKRRREQLKLSIQRRREQMTSGMQLQLQTEKEMSLEQDELGKMREAIHDTEEKITGQRRRICDDLQNIYPVEPVSGKTLAFEIRGLPLPNGNFDDAKEDETAAALGHVAQVVNLLAHYLDVILPYPVTPNGSTSVINDPLAVRTKQDTRIYPLFMKNVVRYRFEYGVFLLDKNVEILAESLGLTLIDGTHMLPNLKYLLFVATAGKGELPARKAGGIRGLLRQQGALSRKGSMDSAGSSVSEDRGKNLDEVANGGRIHNLSKSNGKPISAVQSLQRTVVPPGSRLREVE